MHPEHAEALVRQRMAELRSVKSHGPTQPASSRQTRTAIATATAAGGSWRRRTGWFLVGVGLRLALPRPAPRSPFRPASS